MAAKNLLITLAAVVFGIALAGTVGADEEKAQQSTSMVSELVAALDQVAKVMPLIAQLDQKLAKAGPEADQLAAEILQSREKIVRHPEARKYVETIADQKKSRLAALLLLRIARAQAMPRGGHVVVGQLVVEDAKVEPEMVLAQMPILEEGYFADQIKTFDRPLGFRAIGYRDLDVPLASYKGDLAILEKIVLKPLPASERVTLKGTVVLDGSPNAKSAQVRVSAAVPPPNTVHGGYSPRTRWPEGMTATVTESGEFTVEGLNPSEITVVVSAEDHVNHGKRLKLSSAGPTDLGTLRLFSTNLASYIGGSAPEAEPLKWEADFAAAAKRAEAEKKPLMVMMTATWCGPCKLLEEKTLSDPWICSFLSRFVVVKAYEDRDVEAKYGLQGYPTLVFTDPSGKLAYKCVGYKPTFDFARDCAKAFESLSIAQPEAIQKLIDKQVIKLK